MFDALTRRVLEPVAVGVDISDLTVKFIRLSRRGRQEASFGLDYFGETDIPPGVVVDGEIKNEVVLASILQNQLRSNDGRIIHERYCIVSLPEEKSFVRVIELPNLTAEDAARAVRWEVEGVIPLSIDQIFFDFEFTPVSASDHRRVLITAFPRAIVETYHRVLGKAGFLPLALELESQAISRAIITESSILQPVIIIDVGMNRTSFIIFSGGSLVFTKSIPVGGRNFESAIAEGLGISLKEARSIKIEAGLNKKYREGRVFDALAPHLAVIVDELRQQLRFYREHPGTGDTKQSEIERVILCGGDANLIGLEKYIATAIKKFTILGNPFVNLHLAPDIIPPIPKNQSLKYTTALGLALRGIGY